MIHINRRQFIQTAASAAAGLGFSRSTLAAPETEPGILGHGSHRYKLVPGWGVLDSGKVPVGDCHGMAQDARGRILLLTNDTKNNIIVYDKAGKLLETWGTRFPGAHGLALVNENDDEFLFITDHNLHKVFKLALASRKTVAEFNYPAGIDPYKSAAQFKPTDIVVAPNGDVFVCDGYGESYLIRYDTSGKVLDVLGGREDMLTPHGIALDTRKKDRPVLLVAARGLQALKRYTLDGVPIDTIPLPGAQVCTVCPHGEELYAPNLNGFLSILDRENRVVSNPGGTTPAYDAEGKLQKMGPTDKTFKHPHDVLVDDEDSIYVAQWNSNRTYPIKLQRVNA
jgi:peptidylamidoglycolate lyase